MLVFEGKLHFVSAKRGIILAKGPQKQKTKTEKTLCGWSMGERVSIVLMEIAFHQRGLGSHPVVKPVPV